MIAPMVATVAAEEPEMAPKNAQAKTVTIAKPPRRWPTKESAKPIRRGDKPPPSIRAPARIKVGMAIRGKESQAVNMVVAM